jgi:hypothetical protein
VGRAASRISGRATPGEAREVSISQAVAEIVDNRAVIEQVKGVLMYVYELDADTAPSPAVPHVYQPAIQLTSNDALHAGQTPDQVAGSQPFALVDIKGMIDADVH